VQNLRSLFRRMERLERFVRNKRRMRQVVEMTTNTLTMNRTVGSCSYRPHRGSTGGSEHEYVEKEF